MLVEDYLKEFIDDKKARKVLYLALCYPLAFLSVTSWRGLWMMLDLYTTTALSSAILSHVVGFLIVLALKTTYSLIAVPGYCITERHIHPPGKILQVKKCFRQKTSARMLNSFVTVFIIGGAVISYWRGTWLIIVAVVKPLNDMFTSSIALICLSYSLLSWCYSLSACISTGSTNPPYSLLSRSLEQVFVYILGFGVVASWVGIWHLMDIYLLPGWCVFIFLYEEKNLNCIKSKILTLCNSYDTCGEGVGVEVTAPGLGCKPYHIVPVLDNTNRKKD